MPIPFRTRLRRAHSVIRILPALLVLGWSAFAPALARAPDAGGGYPPGSEAAGAVATGADVAGSGLRAATLGPSSAITFQASDAFGGFDGKAPVNAFSLKLDPRRPASAQATLEVKSDAVTTGNFLRDVNAARTVFESSDYPVIRYTLTGVKADPAILPDGRSADVTVRGRLRMHGVEREVVAHGKVRRHGGELDADLSLPIRLSDFHMTRPHFLTVTVEDRVEVDVHLVLRLAPAEGG